MGKFDLIPDLIRSHPWWTLVVILIALAVIMTVALADCTPATARWGATGLTFESQQSAPYLQVNRAWHGFSRLDCLP